MSSLGARHFSGAIFVDPAKDARLESRAPSNERLPPPPRSAFCIECIRDDRAGGWRYNHYTSARESSAMVW
jgi:hypothetical protein